MSSPGQNPPSAKLGRPSSKLPKVKVPDLWPLHPKPLSDELLSSWLVRLAHAHGLKVQTLCRLFFGNEHQVWNRDIDRLAPAWLTESLSLHTATPYDVVRKTTLRVYEGRLYRRYQEASTLPWILPLRIFHRKHQGYGLQFCPRCLAEDMEPYFRKRWRVAFCTYCPTHGVMLHDRCPHCEEPVVFHRLELGETLRVDSGPLALCFNCGFDFRTASAEPPVFYAQSAFKAMNEAVLRLGHKGRLCKPRSVLYYNVLHHLCWLMVVKYRRVRLRDYVCGRVGAPKLPITPGRLLIEARSVQERHYLVQLAFWILADLEVRLTGAWRARTVTYSALLRDFEDRPYWYDSVVGRFSDWRRTLVASDDGDMYGR